MTFDTFLLFLVDKAIRIRHERQGLQKSGIKFRAGDQPFDVVKIPHRGERLASCRKQAGFEELIPHHHKNLVFNQCLSYSMNDRADGGLHKHVF